MALAAQPALATETVYTDRNAFLAATGSTSATGALPTGGGGYYSTLTVGSVTFKAPSFVVENWSTLLPGTELVVSDGAGSVGGIYNDGIDALFASPVHSAGFDFHEPTASSLIDGCNLAHCVNSSFELQLYNGSTAVAVLAWTPPKNQATFWGVSSSVAFNRLLVRETVGSDDNEFYGQFYTGSTAPVPEPSSWMLWAAGVAALGALSRSNQRAR
jgi:hypothetical protein